MADEEALLAFDHGLVRPEVGGWTEEKHRHVSLYSTLFSSGMKEGKARQRAGRPPLPRISAACRGAGSWL